MIEKFKTFRAAMIAAALAFVFGGGALFAQSFTLPPLTIQQGMMAVQGGLPTLTGGTLVAGSTDSDGFFSSSATSGVLTFNKVLTNAPFCLVVDTTATPIAVYTTTNSQITLTTMTSAHGYRYHCAANNS